MRTLVNLQFFNNTNVTTDAGMSVEMKTFYDKTLIKLAKANLVHDQFAQQRDIPANNGKTIEFRQFEALPKAVVPITEGVTPNGRKLRSKNITATVQQYGDYVEVSDMLKMTAIDNVIVEATEEIGDQAGRTLDTITRDACAAGTNVIFVDNTSAGHDSRDDLTTSDTLKPIYFEKAATQLKAANAPTFDGYYVAVIHPYASYDLRTSSEWIDLHKYTDAVSEVFEGEIGKLGKVRFVESTEAKVWKDNTCPVNSLASTIDYKEKSAGVDYSVADVFTTEDADTAYASDAALIAALEAGTTVFDADGNSIDPNNNAIFVYTPKYYGVFSTLVVGKNAYATTKVDNGGLQTIIKQLGAGDDPLNQRATIGWKAIKTSKILVEPYMVRIESLSAYSADVDAN